MELHAQLIFFAGFAVVCVASWQIGHFLGRFHLPHITGYLLVGALAGPYLLGLLPAEAAENLRFVDALTLAVIAFVAGSELYLKELRSRTRPILLIIGGIITAALGLIGVALFLLTESIPFVREMLAAGTLNTLGRVAIALLGATVLLALSPPSTIAVIKEVRARGPFTKTILGVTVTMDVVIIVLFAVAAALAGALLNGSTIPASFVPILIVDLALAVALGYLVGRAIEAALVTGWRRSVKIALTLLLGGAVFLGGAPLTELLYAQLGVRLRIEALLVAMVAGFTVTNFSQVRDQFDSILHDIGPWVYVAFFTLTGIGLKLDILLSTLGVAAALFAVRLVAIYIGAFAGTTVTSEPPQFRRLIGLGLVTQAGIALGLAREVSTQFPSTLGSEFATLIVSVVVLNEVFGPPLLKFVLRRVGEAHEPEPAVLDGTREAVILGIEQQSITLARQLAANGWAVLVADTNREQVERLTTADVAERHIPDISEAALRTLMGPGTDALVALMPDDADNLRACQLAYEVFGCRRLVVRLKDVALTDRFRELGALVVDQTSAMVNLLDQSVRAPQTAALLLHSDTRYDIVQITVTERNAHNMLLRDLRLPNDVLVIEISRSGQNIVPSGYTAIQQYDEMTLLGSPDSLREVTLRLGY